MRLACPYLSVRLRVNERCMPERQVGTVGPVVARRRAALAVASFAVVAGGGVVAALRDDPSAGRPVGRAFCVDQPGDVEARQRIDGPASDGPRRFDIDSAAIEVDEDDLVLRLELVTDIDEMDGTIGFDLHYSDQGTYSVSAFGPTAPIEVTDFEFAAGTDTNSGEGTLETEATVTAIGPEVEARIPINDLPRLGPDFDWEASTVGVSAVDLTTGTATVYEDRCGTGRLPFPGAVAQPVAEPGSAATRGTSRPSAIATGTAEDVAADLIAAWERGDRAAAALVVIDGETLDRLFAATVDGASISSGCEGLPAPQEGDPNPTGEPIACTFENGENRIALLMDSTPSAGLFVFAIRVESLS